MNHTPTPWEFRIGQDNTDGEVATYHHIEDVLNTIEKEA